MRFSEAFESSGAPTRLGPVRLRYEEFLLVGEPAPTLRSLRPTVLFAAGVAAALGAVGALLLPAPEQQALAVVAALALLLASAGLLFVSVARERRQRARDRFVVNFDTLTLRLDDSNALGRPRTRLVPFDAVEAVEIHEGPAGCCSLLARVRTDPNALHLVRDVPLAQRAELERLGRVLAGAFGLGARPVATGPDPIHDGPR